jgi:ribose transport system substrate-binding protein
LFATGTSPGIFIEVAAMRNRAFIVTSFIFAAMLAVGCRPAAKEETGAEITNPRDYTYPLTAGEYTVIGIYTDDKDGGKAKANAQNVLTAHPDVKVMVGLWAPNGPMALSALQTAGKVGEVKIVAFDEWPATLQGIKDGEVHGTVVQQPFMFGYRSVEFLAAMKRGKEVKFPGDLLYIPTTIIKRDNVEDFQAKIAAINTGNGTSPAAMFPDQDKNQRARVAFLTNSEDPFWDLAEQGCILAARDFGVECDVRKPTNGTTGQKQYIEEFITQQYDGLAMSVIDPVGQADIINEACETMNVITQDADAPNTKRKFYLGTSNYMAGREAGKLVKEASPDGGKVALFVGMLDVLNAQERALGVIHELMDKEIPAEFAEQKNQ